jgi:alpha-glucosidase
MTVKRTGEYDEDRNPLGYVIILGVEGEVSEVTFGNTQLGPESWSLDSNSGALRVNDLDKLTLEGAWTSEWTLKWS